MRFESREHAARLLAERLRVHYKGKNPLVLAIPRGAVPMAKIIADELDGELDVVLVRKLGYPMQPELAIGAVDESGKLSLSNYGFEIAPEYLEVEEKRQLEILRRWRARYTPSRVSIDPHDRLVIVVDDGIATGSTMIAALRAVRARKPKALVGAVAVASPEAARALLREAVAMVYLTVPARLYAVGEFFKDFSEVSDKDVIAILGDKESQVSSAG